MIRHHGRNPNVYESHNIWNPMVGLRIHTRIDK